MKKKLKYFTLNLDVGNGLSVLFVCLFLVSCDDWFNDDDDNNPNRFHYRVLPGRDRGL